MLTFLENLLSSFILTFYCSLKFIYWSGTTVKQGILGNWYLVIINHGSPCTVQYLCLCKAWDNRRLYFKKQHILCVTWSPHLHHGQDSGDLASATPYLWPAWQVPDCSILHQVWPLTSIHFTTAFHLSYSVHRCVATTREQVELLASLADEEELEFWSPPSLHRYY